MRDKKSISQMIRQHGLKYLAVAVIIVALVCALLVNFGLRAPVEAEDKTVGLLVDYDEMKRIADGSVNVEFPDMLRRAAMSGATGLVIRERILSDWEIAGDILVYTGGQLRFQIELQYGEQAESVIEEIGGLIPEKTYILTKDYQVYDQIFSLLEAKRRYPEPFILNDYHGMATGLHSFERANLGLGFPLARLEEAAAHGYQIIPRIRNWEPVTGTNLAEVFKWVAKIPNLTAIGFNEQAVPGEGTDSIIQDRLAAAIEPLGKPLVTFEFYDQIGLTGISARLGNDIFRVHAISENELRKYENFQDAMERYGLAATERNIRYIYLRFQKLANPAASRFHNMELIEYIHEGLTNEGLTVGDPKLLPHFSIPFVYLYLIGTGVIAAGGWLLALFSGPFLKKRKWHILFILLLVLCMFLWAAGLILVPALARKLFALAASVFFPSLSVILILNLYRKTFTGNHRTTTSELPLLPAIKTGTYSLLHALLQLLIISTVTLIGAMIMSALLSEPVFMLGLDGFMGVKIAHIIPLALVPFILWMREEDAYGVLSGTVKSNVQFWQLGVCFLLLAGVTLYILRTGNDSPDAVLDLEMKLRQFLYNWLGVRPRTTEFLIGHPLMLLLLYYGYRFSMMPVLMLGLMGQASLINTYAHIHTPLMVSLQRSGNGLWLGAIIGIVIIIAMEIILHRIRSINIKRAEV